MAKILTRSLSVERERERERERAREREGKMNGQEKFEKYNF